MADQNGPSQPGIQGRPGQPGQPQGPGPAGPQRGIPGAQQPPTPSQEQIQKIMLQQQQTMQQQAQESQRRAKLLAETQQPGQPVQVLQLDPQVPQQPVQAIPVQPQPVQQPAYPQQPLPPHPVQQPAYAPQPAAPVQPLAPSPIPGMSAAEVIAGPARPQQGGELAQYAQQQHVEKITVPWYPARSGGANVELEDSIIQFVPDSGIAGEGDAQAKVVLALFSEILSLRERVQELSMAPAAAVSSVNTDALERRVAMVENFIMQQQRERDQHMSQLAQNARLQAEAMAARNADPAEVLSSLQSEQGDEPLHTPEEGQDAARADMASKGEGSE